MKLFNVLVYSGDPRFGARLCSERNVMAESGSHATKIVADERGLLPWKQIDAVELRDQVARRTFVDS